jgi:hypothetical protein
MTAQNAREFARRRAATGESNPRPLDSATGPIRDPGAIAARHRDKHNFGAGRGISATARRGSPTFPLKIAAFDGLTAASFTAAKVVASAPDDGCNLTVQAPPA